jgi:hypothetical protein
MLCWHDTSEIFEKGSATSLESSQRSPIRIPSIKPWNIRVLYGRFRAGCWRGGGYPLFCICWLCARIQGDVALLLFLHFLFEIRTAKSSKGFTKGSLRTPCERTEQWCSRRNRRFGVLVGGERTSKEQKEQRTFQEVPPQRNQKLCRREAP